MIQTDDFDLRHLGHVKCRRASHVEPLDEGPDWSVDLRPVGGPFLTTNPDTGEPFHTKTEALAFEVAWLEENYLKCPSPN